MKIGFGVYYSQERRKRILEAILGSCHKSDEDKRGSGTRILQNYRQQLADQMKRVKAMHKEMEETGETVPEDELRMFNFMKKRSDAFERNELEPESMKKLISTLSNQQRNKRGRAAKH